MKHADFFNKNGFVVLKNIVDKKIVRDCLKIAKKIKYKNFKKNKNVVFDKIGKNKKAVKYFQHIENYYPEFYKLQNSKILNLSKKFFKQDTYFSSMGLHNKTPRHGSLTPFHQDNFFNNKKPPFELTIYIPLEKQDKNNGSITYIRGSHKNGVLKHGPSKIKAFSAAIIEKIELNKKNLYKASLKPGDVIFHHANVIHGAEKNISKTRSRFAVSLSIVGVKAKIDKKSMKIYKEFLRLNRSIK